MTQGEGQRCAAELPRTAFNSRMARFDLCLPQDVYVCIADGRLVFADLRTDSYRCLNVSSTRAVLRALPLLERRDPVRGTDDDSADGRLASDAIHELTSKGLLVIDGSAGKPVIPARILTPTNSLIGYKQATEYASRPSDLRKFLKAAIKASSKLRFLSLQRTVRGIGDRGQKHRSGGRRNHDLLAHLVNIFFRLRPLYPRSYICRFDSLALLEFLAFFERYPSWVFGVRTEPFSAHCWVQEGDWILNDTVERVRRYTPIMVF